MDALQRIHEAALSHPFYADSLRGTRRFEDCPVLEKAVLYERVRAGMADPAFRRGTYFSPTGGTTTGLPLYFPTAIRENQRQRALLARRLGRSGLIRPSAIALNLFSRTRLSRSLEIFNDYCERCGATVLPVGADAPDEEAWTIARQFGATMVMGMPSRLIALARWLAAEGKTLEVESVLFAGELLHPRKRLILDNLLKPRRFAGVYGSAEMGVVAYQPDVEEPPVYRFPKELIHVEILDPDAEGFGRLVATNLVRTRHPLLRYDTGDVGRLAGGTDGELLVELRGRANDSFAIGENYYHLREFAPVLDRFAQSQVVIAFDEAAGMDRISFRMVPDEFFSGQRREEVTESIRSLLEPDERTFITDVAFVSPEALVRLPGSWKVPSFIDLRGRGRNP